MLGSLTEKLLAHRLDLLQPREDIFVDFWACVGTYPGHATIEDCALGLGLGRSDHLRHHTVRDNPPAGRYCRWKHPSYIAILSNVVVLLENLDGGCCGLCLLIKPRASFHGVGGLFRVTPTAPFKVVDGDVRWTRLNWVFGVLLHRGLLIFLFFYALL